MAPRGDPSVCWETVAMKTETGHAKLETRDQFDLMTTGFGDNSGYRAIVKNANDSLVAQLTPFDIDWPGLSAFTEYEIFISEDNKTLLVFKMSAETRRTSQNYIDVFGVSKSDELDICKVIRDNVGLQVHPGSSYSAQKESRLTQLAGSLSPNGKKLADAKVRKTLQTLYDDDFRTDIATIVNAIGDNPVSEEFLVEMDRFKSRHMALSAILNDGQIATKRFVILCNSCSSPHLAFDSSSRAEEVMTDADRRCVMCGERNLAGC